MADLDSGSPRGSLAGKHILLGISGGIAAYKAPMLVRGLRALGAEVQVVMTANANEFVSATSLQAVSGRPVRDTLWDAAAEAAMGHIELARWADLVVIAPATANCIAKLAAGSADDLLSTLVLATAAPIMIAPAMNQQMYQHPATQRNLAQISALGYRVVGPASGEQACGEEGPGRMTEPEEIIDHVRGSIGDAPSGTSTPQTQSPQAWHNLHLLVTTGPTKEAIDPVRFISNHSSGKQGLAIAEAARLAGAQVTVIAGPGVAQSHPDINRIDVVSALEMHDAVIARTAQADVVIGVAAVADYRPAEVATQKIKRVEGRAERAADENASIELVENPDIIAAVAAANPRPLVIGFAAETHNTMEHARAKRLRKGLDAIVVNDVSDASIGFNSADNAATLIWEGGELVFAKQSKQQLANALIGQIPDIFAARLNLADAS